MVAMGSVALRLRWAGRGRSTQVLGQRSGTPRQSPAGGAGDGVTVAVAGIEVQRRQFAGL